MSRLGALEPSGTDPLELHIRRVAIDTWPENAVYLPRMTQPKDSVQP